MSQRRKYRVRYVKAMHFVEYTWWRARAMRGSEVLGVFYGPGALKRAEERVFNAWAAAHNRRNGGS